MHPIARFARAAIAAPALALALPAAAQTETAPSAAELAAEIEALKSEYETRIQALESQLGDLEAKSEAEAAAPPPAQAPAPASRTASDNAFNPAIGVVLDGRLANYSEDGPVEIPGFQVGHHGERGGEGFALGHSEIVMSSNVDDKFFGNLTLGLGSHDGATELEIEEAFIQTLPGAGLPDGLRIKAGRALWTFGYLNELHAHADDFADRPLPYRTYLDGHYNDDGAEFAWVLPSDLYAEIGGGAFRGDDTPFAGSKNGLGAWSAWARLGGDIGRNSSWRIGGYVLTGEATGRGGGHDDHGHGENGEDEHGHDECEEENGHGADECEEENGEDEHGHDECEEEHGHGADECEEENGEDEHGEEEREHDHDHGDDFAEVFSGGAFTGDTRLWGVDFRYIWAPTGNARESELILQGEYFRSDEDGTYELGTVDSHRLDGSSWGWYAQAVYRFMPRWRIGARYARLHPPSAARLGHDPWAASLMADWTNSEFGRIRLQYNREELSAGATDNQFLLQYVMSLGAHAAHTF